MRQKDGRIRLMNEILNGIKVLKLYGWEFSFGNRAEKVRDKELLTLRRMAILSAVSALSWFMAPYLVKKAREIASNFLFYFCWINFELGVDILWQTKFAHSTA